MCNYHWDILYGFCYTAFNTLACNRVKFDSATMTYNFYHNDTLIGTSTIEAIELYRKSLL